MNKILRNFLAAPEKKNYRSANAGKNREGFEWKLPSRFVAILFSFSYFSSSSMPVMPNTHTHVILSFRCQKSGNWILSCYVETCLFSESHKWLWQRNISLFLAISIPMTTVNSCCVYVRYTPFPAFVSFTWKEINDDDEKLSKDEKDRNDSWIGKRRVGS